MKISNFINTGFKEYCNYDNERSIPHIMDGLKITQRKVLYAFVEHIGYQKIVCDKAGMRAADLTKYHHGATSMIDVLVKMNRDYPGSNNLPLFEKHGQFGTRLIHKASSERYISTKLNDTYKKLFDSSDNFILDKQYDDGDEIEPRFYLPKLPLLLINGSDGTGNGYASTTLQYHVDDVKNAVLEVLSHGLIQTNLTPYINGYYGSISKDHSTGQVTYLGSIERKGANTLIIHELTPSAELAGYKDVLNQLRIEKTGADKDLPPLIKDYDNESTEDEWKFIVEVPRSTMQLSDQELLVKFKLIERTTENLTVWMPNGKLRKFNTVESLLEEWVRLRLEFYETRRLDQIERLVEETSWLQTKMKFIQHWNRDNTQLIKLNKSALVANIKQNVVSDDEFVARLLSIRISNLAIDEIKELQSEIDKLTVTINVLGKTTSRKMMTAELKGLKL